MRQDVLSVEVVDLQRGTTDALRRDEVQECRGELGERGRDERDVGIDRTDQRGSPRYRDQRISVYGTYR